ncbi:MAG TPA: hypothetical protein PK992_15085, partial [Planctomycetaceae bacterium]|nr:hypothetical protein [Planctomycetaceae bacterium]
LAPPLAEALAKARGIVARPVSPVGTTARCVAGSSVSPVGRQMHTSSPLRKYSTTDFRLDEKPIRVEAKSASIEILAPNQMIVHPLSDDFSVVVTGFDQNRDLFLQARNSQEQNEVSEADISQQVGEPQHCIDSGSLQTAAWQD